MSRKFEGGDDAAPVSLLTEMIEARGLQDLAKFALNWVGPELIEQAPKLVFLRGPMGAGKTAFVGKVAEILGADEAASPSFALHTRYEGIRGVVEHFDLDRLKDADDLESTGFWDVVGGAKDDRRRFVIIEWASRLDEFGFGSEGAVWTTGFRTWSMQFEGPPHWRIMKRRLSS